MGVVAANCAEMWFCHADRLLPGVLCDLMILHACEASRGEKHHFRLAVPLSGTLSSKAVSSSDFRAMHFVLESLLEERASCWCPHFKVCGRSGVLPVLGQSAGGTAESGCLVLHHCASRRAARAPPCLVPLETRP